jgi:thiamine-phosphate diphosphorylase
VESARALLGPGKLIGYSTHVLEQVREADRSTADYVAFGPIFPTASKENPDAVVGLAGLREARKATSKPLVAIGGITLENARAVIAAGADSVAVIRGLVGAPTSRERAQERVLLQIVRWKLGMVNFTRYGNGKVKCGHRGPGRCHSERSEESRSARSG